MNSPPNWTVKGTMASDLEAVLKEEKQPQPGTIQWDSGGPVFWVANYISLH